MNSVAQVVELDKAISTALKFNSSMNKTVTLKSSTINDVEVIEEVYSEEKAKNEHPLCYVLRVNERGFVIVSGDERISPILGYSFENKYDKYNLPVDYLEWLNEMKQQIQRVRNDNNFVTSANVKEMWADDYFENESLKSAKSSVAPLVSCIWNQGCSYNDFCPEDDRCPCSKVLAGCVAVAMAQIMYYWQYPSQNRYIPGYFDDVNVTNESEIENSSYGNLNALSGYSFEWSKMLDDPYSFTSTRTSNPEARLIYYCGVAVKMNYGPNGSGANSGMAYDAFKDYFDYKQTLEIIWKSDYSNSEWTSILKEELDNNRPIYYRGSSESGGHAFVLDGYDANDMFHINWGWGGNQNGYFYLNTSKSPDIDYVNYQGAIIGIEPNNSEVNLAVNTNLITLDSNANSFSSFSITSNTSWTVSKNQTWLSVSPTSGSNNATVTVTASSENTLEQNRTGTVTITGDDVSADKTVLVSQKGQPSTNSLNVAFGSNGGIASAISEGYYDGVTHNSSFSNDGENTTSWASQWSMPAWLIIQFDKVYSIDKVGVLWGAGTHNQQYSISLSEDGSSWKTVVPVRSSNTDAGYTNGNYHGSTSESHEIFDIDLVQAQYVKINITATSAPASHIFQAIVHELEAYATEAPTLFAPTVTASNGTYAGYIQVSWTKVSGATGYDLYRNTSNNSSTATKIGSAASTYTTHEDTNVQQGVTYYYWVKAKSNSIGSYVYSDFSNSDSGWLKEETKVLSVSTTSITLDPSVNSSSSFSITSNTSWTVSKDQTWLTITPTSGSNNASITVTTLTENTSEQNRKAIITISGSGVNADKTILVTQEKHQNSNSLNVALAANGGIASAISEGYYAGVTHRANGSNDGYNNSSWASQWSMPAWLVIEFDKTYTIDKVGVLWGKGTHNQQYSISLSEDGNNWNNVVPTRNSNTDAGYTNGNYIGSTHESHEVFEITPVHARYIWINITATSAPASHIFQAIVNELEAYATTEGCNELVWEDEFEEYNSGTFPNKWIADGNATIVADNYIDNSTKKDGAKSFKLFGVLNSCWGALAYREVSVEPPYYIAFDVKNGTEQLSGCHPDRAGIGLRKGTSWINSERSLVYFKNDGMIYTNGDDLLTSYSTDTWINVIVKYELPSANQVKTTFWIDNNFIGEFSSTSIAEENELNNLQLGVNEGSAWFDNVRVYKSLCILDSISIDGATLVDEGSTTEYTCTAYYSNGTSEDITLAATWSVNSNYATINAEGVLISGLVNSDQSCTIMASYGDESDFLEVTIKNYNCNELVWEDKFEDYESETFPNKWVADGNAVTYAENYIDNNIKKDGANSLKLFGALNSCWGALAYRAVSVEPPYYISFDVKNGNEQLTGCHPDGASIALRKGTSWTNPARALVDFRHDGMIYGNGDDVLTSYSKDTWINVTVKYELPSSNQVKTTFWINNNLIGEFNYTSISEESELNNLQLAAQEGSAWFDNVKVYKSLCILDSITIDGATIVDEGGMTEYACTAYYPYGISEDITTAANWSVSSDYATISSKGVLTAGSVNSDQTFAIIASYEGNSVSKEVTIKNIEPTLSSVTISGSNSVNENSSASYTCAAYYSDGSSKDITTIASWSVISNYASISSSGVLTANSVNANQLCMVVASYRGKSDTLNVTIIQMGRANTPPEVPQMTWPDDGAIVSCPFILTWTCQDQEYNSLTFQIKLGDSLNAFENWKVTTDYYFTVDDLSVGTYYWKVTAYDGTDWSDESNVSRSFIVKDGTSVTSEDLPSLKIYPNPFKQKISVEGDFKNQNITIELLNLTGEMVYSKSLLVVDHLFDEIDLSGCSDGIYCVHVYSNNQSMTSKVLKKN